MADRGSLVRLSLGPYTDGNDRLEVRVREAMTAASNLAGVGVIIKGFELWDTDAVVDAVFVEDNPGDSIGGVLAFHTAVLWFFEVTNHQFAGIELFDPRCNRMGVVAEGDGEIEALARWLRELASAETTAVLEPWRQAAEVLVLEVDRLVSSRDDLLLELGLTGADLSEARDRIRQLEDLNRVLQAELRMRKGRKTVALGVARLVIPLVAALVPVADAHLTNPHPVRVTAVATATAKACEVHVTVSN